MFAIFYQPLNIFHITCHISENTEDSDDHVDYFRENPAKNPRKRLKRTTSVRGNSDDDDDFVAKEDVNKDEKGRGKPNRAVSNTTNPVTKKLVAKKGGKQNQ